MKIQAILCLWAIAGYFVLPMLPSARGRANALMQAIIGGPIAWFYILFRGAWELWVIVGAFVVTVLFVARLCPYMAARCAQADEIYSAVCGEGLHDGR